MQAALTTLSPPNVLVLHFVQYDVYAMFCC
jgi:hypothetical protein